MTYNCGNTYSSTYILHFCSYENAITYHLVFACMERHVKIKRYKSLFVKTQILLQACNDQYWGCDSEKVAKKTSNISLYDVVLFVVESLLGRLTSYRNMPSLKHTSNQAYIHTYNTIVTYVIIVHCNT